MSVPGVPRLAGQIVLAAFLAVTLMAARPAPSPDDPVAIDDMIVPADLLGESATGNVDLWPGVIPYGFDGSVSPLNQTRMLAAMAELEGIANVKFVPHAGEQAWLLVKSGGANSAHLGMLGGQQSVTISSWNVHYTIVHELFHVLGFIHEHQRSDRDSYITVNEANATPGALGQLDVIFASTSVGPYDLDSVMHYGQCQGSACGTCTPGCEVITVLPPNQAWQPLIGQRDHLSVEDQAGLVAVYGSWDCNGNGIHDYFDVTSGTEPDCNGNGRPDACEPPGTIPDCNGNGIGDPCEIASGAATDCNGNGVPDDCDITAGLLDDCDGDGVADLCQLLSGSAFDCNTNGVLDSCDIQQGTSTDIDRNGMPDECDVPTFLRVDAGATGLGDGSTWDDAVPSLTDALAMAAAAPAVVKEIWVAAGVYRPAGPGGSRSASFELTPGVPVFGGFAGFETQASQRDVLAHPTLLSGDLDGDDLPDFGNRSDNSFHVVRAPPSTGPASVLDGFLVQGGQADGPGAADRRGAGLLAEGGLTLRQCRVSDNRALDAGGGLQVDAATVTVTSCRIESNRAGRGGGLAADSGAVTVANSLLANNEADTLFGGAIGATGGDTTVLNATLAGNRAAGFGGGAGVMGGTFVAANSILWGNAVGPARDEAAQLGLQDAAAAVDRCCIQGLTGILGGTGNVPAPAGGTALFTNPLGPDGLPWTGDENLRPAPGSVVIDAGDNLAVPPGLTTDLGGGARFLDDAPTPDTGVSDGQPVVDMGAWEYRCWADVTGDGRVDLADVGLIVTGAAGAGSPGGGPGPAGPLTAADGPGRLWMVGDCP